MTEVDLPAVSADTADNPLYLTSFTLFLGIALLAMGALYVLTSVQGLRRAARRADRTDDGWPGTIPAPGAVGMPAGFGLDRVLRYRPVSSWYSAILQAAVIEFAFCIGALRFGADLLTIAIVAWATVPLAALYVWWIRGYELTLTESEVRYRSPSGGFAAPWSQVRLVTRTGQPSLRVQVGGRTRRIGLVLFTRRNPANAGLLRQMQMRLEAAAATGALAPETPAATPLLGVRTWRRLGAWAIDAVVVFVLGMVAIALLIGPAGSHLSDGLNVAIVFGAPTLVLVGYLLPLWRRGRTLGMVVLRLRLVDAETGGRPGWRQLWLRFLLVLPWVCTVAPIGLLVGGRRPQYDRVAGTVVRDGGDGSECAAGPSPGALPNDRASAFPARVPNPGA